MRARDQGDLDAPILSQSRKAQNCCLAMAAMRPDPPRARDGPGLIMTQSCWARHDQLTNARGPRPLIIVISAAICPSVNPSINACNARRS